MAEKVKKKLTTKQITAIIMLAVLLVAVIAVAVALIVVSEFNTARKEADGFVYSLERGQATILEYTGEDVNVVVPDKIGGRPVVGIAESAFAKNAEISSVTIESEADNFTLGARAFYDMGSLVSVVLPDGLKSIPENAFSGCDSLMEVTMGNGVESIGAYAFSECPTLSNIYISVSSGGKGEDDSDYNAVAQITMPSSLQTIGEYAFYNSITASAANNRKVVLNAALTTIENNAFDGCNWIQYVSYADAESVVSLTEIGNDAFYGCTSLQFRKNASASSQAFFLTKALDDKVLESVGDRAFDGCTYNVSGTSNKATLNFYDNVEYIGDHAFRGVLSVKEVRFYECSPELGEGAFYGAANLTTVSYMTQDEAGEYKASKETSLSPEVTEVPALLFYGSGLKGFIIGENVTSIGDGAFSGLKNADALDIAGGETSTEGIVGAHFALYKLDPYYTAKTNESTCTTANQHYLLMDSSFNSIIAYVGAFDGEASMRKNDTVGEGQSGMFKFLQQQTIPMTELRAYAFAEVQFDYIYLPEKITSFGANVFNGLTLDGEEKILHVIFENKQESYYNGLVDNSAMSADMFKGAAEDVSIAIHLGVDTTPELSEKIRAYLNTTAVTGVD